MGQGDREGETGLRKAGLENDVIGRPKVNHYLRFVTMVGLR